MAGIRTVLLAAACWILARARRSRVVPRVTFPVQRPPLEARGVLAPSAASLTRPDRWTRASAAGALSGHALPLDVRGGLAAQAALEPALLTGAAPKEGMRRASLRPGEEMKRTRVARQALSTEAARSVRRVESIEKFARLPVWPAWNGVAIFLLGCLSQPLAARLEDYLGGRVCPNFFDGPTSPFVMLVHHRHSFAPWDLLRYFQRTFFPEGFPAHPHRGFVTLTYCMKGGMLHRDSLGIKQQYGAERRHGGKQAQWLTTGAGMLHEEMWDVRNDPEASFWDKLQPSDQELYQIWLNVPSWGKMVSPEVKLVGTEDNSTPVVQGTGTETVVIIGEHNGVKAAIKPDSPTDILHVKMDSGSGWSHPLGEAFFTCIVYIRQGAIFIDGVEVPAHHTAFLGPVGDVHVKAGADGADFLLLAGVPLGEPVASAGSMVMNTQAEVRRAYADYQTGRMGRPWDHTIDDEAWKDHVEEFGSVYGGSSYGT